MNSLSNLLAHEIVDLFSAEEQIIEALPKMIEKAQNQELKKALNEHLKITEQQKKRLEKVHKLLKQQDSSSEEELGDTECSGMKGLIKEGQKALEEEMEPDVMDAAIIASAQKIEHYEISGYGTARAFARELGYSEVEKLLKQTLDEEYQSDDTLTSLAVGQINDDAEDGEDDIDVRKLPAGRQNGRGKSNPRTATTQRSSSRASTRSASNGTASKRGRKSTTSRTKKSATAGKRKSTTGAKSKSSSSSSSNRSRSKSRGR